MMTNLFQWEVELPARTSASLGKTRPYSYLRISTEEHGDERFTLPLVVGRTVQKKRELDELCPSSRAELLYEVREISMRCAALRIERLINKREYAVREIEEKLRSDGYSPSVCERALSKAIDCGLVSNDRYATSFIRTKVSSGWGTARIERELKKRGIEPQTVPGWPHDFLQEEDEDERAYAVARARRLADKNAYEKLVRYLCGRGYDLSCAMRVSRRVIEESRKE